MATSLKMGTSGGRPLLEINLLAQLKIGRNLQVSELLKNFRINLRRQKLSILKMKNSRIGISIIKRKQSHQLSNL